MAQIGKEMVDTVFVYTEAEKAFRPWWDKLEDYLVYGLIMLGKTIIIKKNNFNESFEYVFQGNLVIAEEVLLF